MIKLSTYEFETPKAYKIIETTERFRINISNRNSNRNIKLQRKNQEYAGKHYASVHRPSSGTGGHDYFGM